VIDPAEHGHIGAHDQPVRYEHPAHDHHDEAGCGDRASACLRWYVLPSGAWDHHRVSHLPGLCA
jgi:hypothetical protein